MTEPMFPSQADATDDTVTEQTQNTQAATNDTDLPQAADSAGHSDLNVDAPGERDEYASGKLPAESDDF